MNYILSVFMFLSFSTSVRAAIVCKTTALRGEGFLHGLPIGPFTIRLDWRQNPDTSENAPYLAVRGRYVSGEHANPVIIRVLTGSSYGSQAWMRDSEGRQTTAIEGEVKTKNFEHFYYSISLRDSYRRGFINVANGSKSQWNGTIECQEETI